MRDLNISHISVNKLRAPPSMCMCGSKLQSTFQHKFPEQTEDSQVFIGGTFKRRLARCVGPPGQRISPEKSLKIINYVFYKWRRGTWANGPTNGGSMLEEPSLYPYNSRKLRGFFEMNYTHSHKPVLDHCE